MKRNHTGHRVGEWHQRAKLTDGQVRNMRHAHERLDMTIGAVAKMFRCPYRTAYDILKYRTRASA